MAKENKHDSETNATRGARYSLLALMRPIKDMTYPPAQIADAVVWSYQIGFDFYDGGGPLLWITLLDSAREKFVISWKPFRGWSSLVPLDVSAIWQDWPGYP